MREESGLIAALTDRARSLLPLWSLPDQAPRLLKYRENAVFQVHDHGGRPSVLRLHRPGYVSDEALAAELEWMNHLTQKGLPVPAPIPTVAGVLFVKADQGGLPAQNADLVSWLVGEPLGASGVAFSHSPDRLQILFYSLGRAMARLHAVSDAWSTGRSIARPHWNADGFVGEQPLWGRFWEAPGIGPSEQHRLSVLREALAGRLQATASQGGDYGLIHADLVRENVLVSGTEVRLIDFDDSGYGWRLFDLATTLFRNRREPYYALIRSALLDGYASERPLPDALDATLDLFMILRSVTYIGWAAQRPELSDAGDRLQRYLGDTFSLAETMGL